MNHVSGLTHQQAECLAISLGVKQSQLDPLRSLYPADPQLFAYYAIRKWRDSCELAEDKAKEELAMAVRSLPSRHSVSELNNRAVAMPVIAMAPGSTSGCLCLELYIIYSASVVHEQSVCLSVCLFVCLSVVCIVVRNGESCLEEDSEDDVESDRAPTTRQHRYALLSTGDSRARQRRRDRRG